MNQARPPHFGFILFGGSLSGALVRDVRLANELADRGFAVSVWWVMDQPKDSPLRPSIRQHLLFNGFRYYKPRMHWLYERLGRLMSWYWPDRKRARSLQKRPHITDAIMQRYLTLIAQGVQSDAVVLDRFIQQVCSSGVTIMMPMLAALGSYLVAAGQRIGQPISQLVTFQGYELYVNYARAAGVEQELYTRLRQIAGASAWPAIAVSHDYRKRVIQDIGVDPSQLVAVHPGVPARPQMTRDQGRALLAETWRDFDPHLPLIAYLGRQDAEKGIDLLLYAARLLRQDGKNFQLVIAGPTLFGASNQWVLRQIATDLRLDVLFKNQLSDRLRDALFAASRMVVYPPIHREPFGMVPVEAAAYGTPVIVPDHGGITEAIRAGTGPEAPCAGLTFRAWDSGDLAQQIGRLLEDEQLWQRLSAAGPSVAEYYSVENLADRVLSHIGTGETEGINSRRPIT